MFPTISQRVRVPLRALSLRYRVGYQQYSSGNSVHDSDPEVLEREKDRNLRKEQHLTSTPHETGAPGWNEYLASASEAHVKADKYGEPGPPNSELVSRTVNRLHGRYGTKRTNSREEAMYEKDEVEGPLKTSRTGEAADEYEMKEVRGGAQARDQKKRMTRSEEDVRK